MNKFARLKYTFSDVLEENKKKIKVVDEIKLDFKGVLSYSNGALVVT